MKAQIIYVRIFISSCIFPFSINSVISHVFCYTAFSSLFSLFFICFCFNFLHTSSSVGASFRRAFFGFHVLGCLSVISFCFDSTVARRSFMYNVNWSLLRFVSRIWPMVYQALRILEKYVFSVFGHSVM
jgi:hypothetical protein